MFPFASFSNWWPLIVVLFYIFSLIPTFMSRRIVSNSFQSGSNSCQEVSIFLTMGFVISAFALPIVLAHSDVVSIIHTESFDIKLVVQNSMAHAERSQRSVNESYYISRVRFFSFDYPVSMEKYRSHNVCMIKGAERILSPNKFIHTLTA